MKGENIIKAKPSLGFCYGPEEYKLVIGESNQLFKNREAAEQFLKKQNYPDDTYVELEGVQNRLTVAEMKANGYSLNPDRYIKCQVRND